MNARLVRGLGLGKDATITTTIHAATTVKLVCMRTTLDPCLATNVVRGSMPASVQQPATTAALEAIPLIRERVRAVSAVLARMRPAQLQPRATTAALDTMPQLQAPRRAAAVALDTMLPARDRPHAASALLARMLLAQALRLAMTAALDSMLPAVARGHAKTAALDTMLLAQVQLHAASAMLALMRPNRALRLAMTAALVAIHPPLLLPRVELVTLAPTLLLLDHHHVVHAPRPPTPPKLAQHLPKRACLVASIVRRARVTENALSARLAIMDLCVNTLVRFLLHKASFPVIKLILPCRSLRAKLPAWLLWRFAPLLSLPACILRPGLRIQMFVFGLLI